MSRRSHTIDSRRARSALRWGFLAFLAAIVVQSAGFDSRPDLYDVEYGARLALIRARHAETPDRPLLLVVGSSRTVMAFAPEKLPPLRTKDGAEVMPFNFGHFGAGPIQNLMDITRMLADGVRPRWVFIEMMPTFVTHEGMSFIASHTASRDFAIMHPHMRWNRLYGDYAMRRLSLAPKYPAELLRDVAPDLAPLPITKASPLLPLGGCTFLRESMPAAERAEKIEITRTAIQNYIHHFEIAPVARTTTGLLLDRLRAEGVQAVMLLTPEGSMIRDWYPPGGREALNNFCGDMTREFGVPVVDAREWLSDDDMYDFHHPLLRGSEAFTARLGREVIAPLVATGDTSWAARFDGGPVAQVR
jgi:hypothetical protein